MYRETKTALSRPEKAIVQLFLYGSVKRLSTVDIILL